MNWREARNEKDGRNPKRLFYLRARNNGFLWSGSGWAASRETAQPYRRVEEALAAAPDTGRTALDVMVVFPGSAGQMIIPLAPVLQRVAAEHYV